MLQQVVGVRLTVTARFLYSSGAADALLALCRLLVPPRSAARIDHTTVDSCVVPDLPLAYLAR